MDLGLKGKTAIVTGATRGIGRAIADLFADEGANVAICARKADEVEATVAALKAKGVSAFGQVVDIADGAALKAFMGAVHVLEAAKPFLETAGAEKGDAALIIISSISAAEAASPSAYGAIKAAQIHFAKGVAKENAPKHIRCNVISPGTVFFEGGVWGRVKDGMPAFFEATIKRNPTGRMATPEEIASAAVFLSSPRSAFTTGINMVVDGAISARVNY